MDGSKVGSIMSWYGGSGCSRGDTGYARLSVLSIVYQACFFYKIPTAEY